MKKRNNNKNEFKKVFWNIKNEKIITILLLEWFKKHGRIYPWRKETDPYRILIAEIMLQRTKAEQVVPIYNQFISKFPNIYTLAQASYEDIEYFFAMLGLKWRAKKVKELTNAVINQFNGQIPCSREALLSLPGVGEYIADAVLCFACGKNVAVVDANVCRVISRVFGVKPRGEARRDPIFKQIAQRLLPPEHAKEFNWAIIDFAALVCTPRNPKCNECPLRQFCSFKLSRINNK